MKKNEKNNESVNVVSNAILVTFESYKDLQTATKLSKNLCKSLDLAIKLVLDAYNTANQTKKDLRTAEQTAIIQLFNYCEFTRKSPLNRELLLKIANVDEFTRKSYLKNDDGTPKLNADGKQEYELIPRKEFTSDFVLNIIKDNCAQIRRDRLNAKKRAEKVEREQKAQFNKDEKKRVMLQNCTVEELQALLLEKTAI